MIHHFSLTSGSTCPTSNTPPTNPPSTQPDGPTSDGPSSPTHSTPSGGTSPPTSEPSFQSACTAMNDIAMQLENSEYVYRGITCELNGCGDLNCTLDDAGLRIILHCSPMAVEIHYTEDGETESKNFTRSGTLVNGLIEVTVEKKDGNVLGFAMECPVLGATMVSYTQISLKSCPSGIYTIYAWKSVL